MLETQRKQNNYIKALLCIYYELAKQLSSYLPPPYEKQEQTTFVVFKELFSGIVLLRKEFNYPYSPIKIIGREDINPPEKLLYLNGAKRPIGTRSILLSGDGDTQLLINKLTVCPVASYANIEVSAEP